MRVSVSVSVCCQQPVTGTRTHTLFPSLPIPSIRRSSSSSTIAWGIEQRTAVARSPPALDGSTHVLSYPTEEFVDVKIKRVYFATGNVGYRQAHTNTTKNGVSPVWFQFHSQPTALCILKYYYCDNLHDSV